MDAVLTWLYRRLGSGYFAAYVVFEVVSALAVCAGAIAIISVYEEPSGGQFLHILLVAWGCTLLALAIGGLKVRRSARPLLEWRRAGRPDEGTLEAWRAAIVLPVRFVEATGWLSLLIVALPVSIWSTIEFDVRLFNAAVYFAAALIAIAYAAILHFFASEQMLRPIVRELSDRLPEDFQVGRIGASLSWKLIGSLPLINLITGVVVSGLARDGNVSPKDLGADVIVAVGVAFTLSLGLTLLVLRSVFVPVRELLAATERAREGDLSARVPLTSGDELGALSSSFNTMLTGVEEREKLHEALGIYVDPDVAERVLEEGAMLEGEEVEVTILFVDIRDFTSFAEGAEPEEIVSYLNEFFGRVVPVLSRHGGHVDKFVGDGVLAVFGVPERWHDHADRALAAAREIRAMVDETYAGRLRIGIGVNSGRVLTGAVGGGGRLDMTVIGDPVNVAARVEEATREIGDTVLFTEATRELLRRPEPELEERGSLPVKGKNEPIRMYTPVADGDANSRDGDAPRLTGAEDLAESRRPGA